MGQSRRDFRLADWFFGIKGPSRQYFSLYRAVSQREGENREKLHDDFREKEERNYIMIFGRKKREMT